jgi:hypothetical protein
VGLRGAGSGFESDILNGDSGATLQEFLQVGLQLPAVFFSQLSKFERLQAALRCPHGEEHGGFAAYRAGPDVENHFDLDGFIKRVLEEQKASGDGELVELGSHMAAAFQTDQCQHGSGQLYPRGSSVVLLVRGGHSLSTTMPPSAGAREITKALGLGRYRGKAFVFYSPPIVEGTKQRTALAKAERFSDSRPD